MDGRGVPTGDAGALEGSPVVAAESRLTIATLSGRIAALRTPSSGISVGSAALVKKRGEASSMLSERIVAFQERREEERKRMFHVVTRTTLRIATPAAIALLLGNVLQVVFPRSIVPAMMIVWAVCLLLLNWVVLSCCPYDLLDIDMVCTRNPHCTGGFLVSMSLVALAQARMFPHLHLVNFLVFLSVGLLHFSTSCGCSPPAWWPSCTTIVSWSQIIDALSWGGLYFFQERNKWLAIPRLPSRILAAWTSLFAVGTLLWWAWHHRYHAHAVHGASERFYKAFSLWCLNIGFQSILHGLMWLLLPSEGYEDVLRAAFKVFQGVCGTVPFVVVLMIGRGRLFRSLGRVFDKDGARLRRDGAFVAELLEMVRIQVGQVWWVHREQEDDSYPALDPRRCWRRGLVEEVASESEFRVRVMPDGSAGRLLAPAAATVRVQLPTVGKGVSQEDLLLSAQENLRYVEFESLSLDLMYRVDSRHDPELQASWYALSRPIRPGEKIDYFISNSWHDDPKAKWHKLVEVAEQFQQRNGRPPTFWLDKLCIDQRNISDGLRVLPVNVMACSKLLALCGHTYLSRLWCIWELFTLFAFVSESAALDRIKFVFLGTPEEGLAMLEGMASFHVSTAHCYDPNEEARLRQVIDAVGTARFNKRISNLGMVLARRQPLPSARVPLSPTASPSHLARHLHAGCLASACRQ